MASFVAAWRAKYGVFADEVEIKPRDDENDDDFDMTVHGTTFEVELTAPLSDKLRSERRRIFSVGQAVYDTLSADAALTSAFAGYDVLLRDEASTPMPAKKSAIAATAAAVVGHLTTAVPGPVTAQTSRTHIATQDGIGVFLMAASDAATAATGPTVHASTSNTMTTLSAARTAVNAALAEKDTKSRKYVVIMAGDPSNENLTLPVETAEYELIAYAGAAPTPPLTHVKEAWLHLAGTHELIRPI